MRKQPEFRMVRAMIAFCIVMIAMMLLVPLAYSSPPDNRPPDNRPPDRGNGNGGSDVSVTNGVSVTAGGGDSTSAAEATGTGGAGGSAQAEGGSVGDINISVGSGEGSAAASSPTSLSTGSTSVTNSNVTKVPKQVPNATFYYSPNYLNCGRVLGFQFGNSSGIGSAGIPLPRDRSCDVWLAVNEAQENGHVALSYAFMCEIKNIRKIWGKERCTQLTTEAMVWLEAEIPDIPKGELLADVDVEEIRGEYDARLVEITEQVERETDLLEKRLAAAEARARRAEKAVEEMEAEPEWRQQLRQYDLKTEKK